VEVVVQVVLALGRDADDHAGLPSPPAGSWPASPPPEPAPELGLHAREIVVDLALARELVQLAVDVVLPSPRAVRSSNVPGGLQLADRVGAGAHLLGLVDRALHGQPDVGHLLAHAGRRLGDADLRLRGVVLGLDDLLLGPEGVDLLAQALLGLRSSFCCWALELGHLLVEGLQLGLRDVLALQRDARELLVALARGLTRLRVELDHGLLELLGLHLQALLRRDDVGDALLDVLQRLELALIAVVERLGRDPRPGPAASRSWP
jgi:hypothetical protein